MSISRQALGSRMTALAILASLLFCAYFLIAAPVLAALEGSHKELHDLTVQKARLGKSIANLRAENELSSGARSEGALWSTGREAELTATVQAQLGRLAKSVGVTPRSITPLPNGELFGQASVIMRMEIEAPLETTARLLREIETHAPILAIDAATFRSRTVRSREPAAPRLSSMLTIVAPFRLQEGDQ